MITTSNLADLKPKGKARYHAAKKVKIVHNGKEYTLDSKREYEVYKDLALLDRHGAIRNLKIHPRYELVPKNEDFRGVFYEADYEYEDSYLDGNKRHWLKPKIVLDVKGQKLNKKTGKIEWLKMDTFKLKEKLFRHQYGFKITLIK